MLREQRGPQLAVNAIGDGDEISRRAAGTGPPLERHGRGILVSAHLGHPVTDSRVGVLQHSGEHGVYIRPMQHESRDPESPLDLADVFAQQPSAGGGTDPGGSLRHSPCAQLVTQPEAVHRPHGVGRQRQPSPDRAKCLCPL